MKKNKVYFLLIPVLIGLFSGLTIFAGSINGVTITCPQSVVDQTQVVKDLKTNTFFAPGSYDAFVPLYKKFLELHSQYKTGYVAGAESYELKFPYHSGITNEYWELVKLGTYDPNNVNATAPVLGTYKYSSTGNVTLPADFTLTVAELNTLGTTYRQEISSGAIRVGDFIHGVNEIVNLVAMEAECNTVANVSNTSAPSNSGSNTITTPVPASINLPLNQAMGAPAGGAPIQIVMTENTINDTTASFKFTVKATRSVSTTLVMAYGTAIADLNFDNTNTTAKRVVIHSENIPTVGQVHDVTAPPVLTGLQPKTKYFFQIKDVINNKLYQQYSFTTSGVNIVTIAPPNQTTTNGITLTVNNTVVTAATNDVNGKYTAKINGTVKVNTAKSVGLNLFYGPDIYSFTGPVVIFPAELLAPNTERSFEYTLNDLHAGTRYNFRIRDSVQDLPLTGTYDFVTQGLTPVGAITPYDPNAGPGTLLDYSFPTQLGEPTGDAPGPIVNAPTLVPCGKISDQGGPDANCQMRHLWILIGNVIQFMLVLLIPMTVLACVYTGVQMILHRSIPADLTKYKDRLLKIGVGLVLMLLAFTIVATIMKVFLGDNAARYLLIDITNL